MNSQKHVIIAPQMFVSLDSAEGLEPSAESPLRRTEIPMVWTQEGDNFRLDINLPESGVLDVYFPPAVASLFVNGEAIWENQTEQTIRMPGVHIEMTPAGLRLSCSVSGALHILARCLIDPAAHSY